MNMDEEPVRVLLVDDDEDDCVLTRNLLAEAEEVRFELEWVTTYEAALEAMERAQHHVYLVDYCLGERDGLELLRAAIAGGCKAPIIMLTGWGDHAVDVAAMQAGAADYLDKGQLNPQLLERSIRYAIERKQAEGALREYSERLAEMVEKRTKELRDAHERLVRSEKLAVLGQLAGGVGHELRNPLGVISNAVYFLQMTLSDADETTREYLGIISSEVRNSEKIVSDLLDFSRTRAPEREEVAVSELVVQVLEKHPPPEEVRVSSEIAPDLPPVFVDPRQMGQVLVNLVTNAYQAMPEGGRLVIKTSEVSGKPPRSQWVALSITDTGCGISQENMERLFEPLFTTKARGIGLGLAVSRNLVEANGGSLEVESELGKGSTFTVTLPAKEVGS